MQDINLKEQVAVYASERLEVARKLGVKDDECDKAFEQAMKAVKIYGELTKIDDEHSEELDRQELTKENQDLERDMKRMVARGDRIFKVVEIAAVAVLAPTLTYVFNRKFAEFLCEAEQFESFTSTAGRSLGKIFKFGR